jgi:hypothetical protein
MQRNGFRLWLGACLLGTALAGGCRHTKPEATEEAFQPPPRQELQAGKETPAPSGSSTPTARTFPPAHSDQSTLAAKAPTAPPPRFEIPTTTVVTRIDFRQPADPEEAPVQLQPVPSPQPAPAVAPVTLVLQQPPPTPPVAPPPAPPQHTLGHAADYSWLCGEVQHFRGNWRLRYAGFDEDDRWGGSVTLASGVLPQGLTDGQHVRVKGRLLQGEGRNGPAYEVDHVEFLDAGGAATN